LFLFISLFSHANYPERINNQIGVLENGDDSFTMRIKTLESAKKSILIEALIFTGDESGLYISNILKIAMIFGYLLVFWRAQHRNMEVQ